MISVIIPTAYRWETLQKTLDALFKQTLQPDSIIIADGAKSSSLPGLLEIYVKSKALPVHYLCCEQTGAAVQRNEGVSLAKLQYNPKNFLRYTSNQLVQDYFHSQALLTQLNMASLDETDVDPIYDAWCQLPAAERSRTDEDMQAIH